MVVTFCEGEAQAALFRLHQRDPELHLLETEMHLSERSYPGSEDTVIFLLYSLLTGTKSSMSCPLPGRVRFNGRGSGGGRGSGLGAVGEDTICRMDDSRSAATGDGANLSKQP